MGQLLLPAAGCEDPPAPAEVRGQGHPDTFLSFFLSFLLRPSLDPVNSRETSPPMNRFKTLAMVGLVGIGMAHGESIDSNLRQELSEQLHKAILTQDTKIFNECFAYDELTESGKKATSALQRRIYGWDKAYVYICDPSLGKADGIPNLNGKYLFDVIISHGPFEKGGWGVDRMGGLRKGKTVVLSPAI